MSISLSNKFKSVTASGEKMTANQKQGDNFVGKIVGYVGIENPEYPNMRAKVQIKVDGEDQLFEDVININDSTELDKKNSIGFLQQHVKTAMISAGKTADYSAEVDDTWCSEQLELLANEQATVRFSQKMETGKNGKSSLKIRYKK